MEIDAAIRAAADALRKAQRVFVLAGAGMGVASGLKTFRSDGGYWRDMPVMQLATPEGFERDPVFVWTWYNERFEGQTGAEPNAGHHALVALEQLVPHLFIATQNVDGLQTRAGSRRLVTLHGDLQSVKCTGCTYRAPLTAPFPLDRIAHECGGKLRPNVVWFGEGLPAAAWERAADESARADVTIVAGTSLAVQPAASLARAGDMRVTAIEVNPDASGAANAIVLRTGAEVALPRVVGALRSTRT
jgi:NAD-dependent deacetylase